MKLTFLRKRRKFFWQSRRGLSVAGKIFGEERQKRKKEERQERWTENKKDERLQNLEKKKFSSSVTNLKFLFNWTN